MKRFLIISLFLISTGYVFSMQDSNPAVVCNKKSWFDTKTRYDARFGMYLLFQAVKKYERAPEILAYVSLVLFGNKVNDSFLKEHERPYLGGMEADFTRLGLIIQARRDNRPDVVTCLESFTFDTSGLN